MQSAPVQKRRKPLPLWPFLLAYASCFLLATVLLVTSLRPVNLPVLSLAVVLMLGGGIFLVFPFVLEYLIGASRQLRLYRKRLEEMQFRLHAMEITLSAELLPDEALSIALPQDAAEGADNPTAAAARDNQSELPFMPQPREPRPEISESPADKPAASGGGLLSRALAQRTKDSPGKAVSALIARSDRRSHPETEEESVAATG